MEINMGVIARFRFRGLAAATVAAGLAFAGTAEADTITLAEADTLTGENLVQLVALARAAERGVDAEIISLKSDDVVFQAVLNGQVDIGIGSAYAPIQTLEDAPVRNFYQLRRLAYFPVVDKTKITSWQDLDAAPITVHARGSGTEAIAKFMETVHDIEFSEMSFVPGSEVRAVALRRGTIDATFLDITNTRLVTQEEPDRFGLLPMGDTTGSDSLLYAREDFLEENAEEVQILLEELMRAAREFNADPSLPAQLREELGLLPDLPQELVDEITPYFEIATEADLFPEEGGGMAAAKGDILFLTQSGALTGDPEELDPNDFWDFEPLEKAKAALEGE
jgi:NitT/TauT family transport system substrate-binding protein